MIIRNRTDLIFLFENASLDKFSWCLSCAIGCLWKLSTHCLSHIILFAVVRWEESVFGNNLFIFFETGPSMGCLLKLFLHRLASLRDADPYNISAAVVETFCIHSESSVTLREFLNQGAGKAHTQIRTIKLTFLRQFFVKIFHKMKNLNITTSFEMSFKQLGDILTITEYRAVNANIEISTSWCQANIVVHRIHISTDFTPQILSQHSR